MKKSNDMPYLGTALLDGTSVKNDCQGLVSTADLPFAMNPSKGYFVTANNRVMPERAPLDIGATSVITARAIRINEMIAEGISKGQKFGMNEMSQIQEDLTDVFARDLTPRILKVVKEFSLDGV
jgi:penicillin amidase